MSNIGIGIGIDSVSGGGIPFKSDALFYLDGTILNSSGTYYFVDKTSNARNFLITGYDFDSTWVKGFPYKSAATISAPAGDAALIAADLNSILYTAGTPNQIPVISLFQNMDYKDRMFCRHEAQVVDGNGVETYEPRVKDIVLYANAKTALDLTKCQTYYGVPAIVAGAKFIDPVNGVDATGNGTQAAPYKTHSKVNGLTLTEGTQIYCLTGTIAPIAWSKNYNLKAIGLTKIQNVSGARGIDYDSAGTLAQTIEGYWIDMANVAGSNGINCNPLHNLTLSKNRYDNHAAYAIQNTSANAATLTISNSVFTKNSTSVSCSLVTVIDTCFLKNATTFATCNTLPSTGITIKNSNLNEISSRLIITAKPHNITITGNKYTNCGEMIVFNNAAANSGAVVIKYNTGNSNRTAGLCSEGNRAGYTWDVQNNKHIYTHCTTDMFKVEGESNIFKNNILVSYLATSMISIMNDLTNDKTVDIQNNYLENRNLSCNYLIRIGSETTSANNNKITSTIVKSNRLKGALDFTVGGTVTHGLLLGYIANIDCRYNFISGNLINIAEKGGSTIGVISYNVLQNGVRNLVFTGKGVVNIYNNSIINDNDAITFQDLVLTTWQPVPNGVPSTDSVFKNNLFYLKTNVGYQFALQGTSTTELDYNAYYTGRNNSKSNDDNAVPKTFAEWQALGYEAHGFETTQALVDNIPSTPITGGLTLDAAYDDGLDASTNWGSDSQLPSVVTKQQGVNWDIGAYVH